MYYLGFIIGLENKVCKLVFDKETTSPVELVGMRVGKKNSPFAPPNYWYTAHEGWHSLMGLLYWLSGVECERVHEVRRDMENASRYIEDHMDKLLELFEYPDELESRLDYYRNLYKDRQITVAMIRAERVRLHSLGLDSSLQAAMDNLRGGTK